MTYIQQYIQAGMRPIPEWKLTDYQRMDADAANSMRCPKCGQLMDYEGWHGHRYVALAVCRNCGHEIEI